MPGVTDQALAEWLREPQGTLILTADLKGASALAERYGHLDVAAGRIPRDPRAFNAICACPAGAIPDCFERVVLAGVPCPADLPARVEAYALAGFDEWMDMLPDLDALRDVYKGARAVIRSGERFYTREQALYLSAQRSGRATVTCLAGLWVLDDMLLLRWDPAKEPPELALCPPRKADPRENGRWQTLEALGRRRIEREAE